ncbi:ATP-binding protein [Microbacterium sp. cx-55]|uniref:sensor histidine kinase n=1 Tax=unclassified Microbacterium TaxID=2609290 RepID=UPI001CBC65ED|nr:MULTISPECIES: ATP-binding protein [unclassified Microbacterium]MBZ4486529.1 PAS domain-containing sensor histidine kinase [Microbacterium sp. cx-55]MCC4907502.1 PAS domain-containing sensor histidine kinase [Microbacterium sp. cx-59]UGB36503.1 ATP-binding protein [Microbacterium sp. cx-55]
MSHEETAGVPVADRVVDSSGLRRRIRQAAASFELPPFLENGRGRTTALLQLALCAVVIVLVVVVVFVPLSGDVSLFWLGAIIVLAAGGAAVLVPWAVLSPWWIIAIPLIDIVGILLLRQAQPSAGFDALFLVPIVWLSIFYGLFGYLIGVVAVPLTVLTTVLIDGTQPFTYTIIVLPAVAFVLASISLLLSRQMTAQRVLFSRQTGTMARTLRRAQKQEELLAEVLDTIDFGVIRIAVDGSTTVANEAHARLQRAARSAASGLDERGASYGADGVTPLDRADIPFARAARGEVFDNQIVWFGGEGSRRRALSVTARRTRAVDGADSGAVIVSRDVTSELTALRARDSLVSSVSHELRTPLTSIIGYLELAVDDPNVPARARKNLEIAERNAARLLGIVSDILTASSRSEMSADLTISQQDIDVAEVLRASGEAWEPTAAERAIEIDMDGIRPAPAYADPLRMRQVIDNLISNAVKYNRDGGYVALAVHSDGLATSITVTDSGIGLSSDELHRVFERFFRAGDDEATGTGLGLSISREIVRAHGGEVTVTSAVGVGSTFTVILPATADSLDDPDGEARTVSLDESTGPGNGARR